MRGAVLLSIGLVVLVFAVFGQTRGFDFVNYDDPGYVTGQAELRHGFSVEGLRWASTLSYGGYMPLTGLTLFADAGLYGMQAGGYHFTSVAIHAATAVLLFLFLYRTTGQLWPCALVAALFAVHPLRVESVAWISSRKDVVCGVCWMLTLHAYAAYAKRPGAIRYALVFLAVCAALLAKPMAVTLPFVLVLLDIWPLGRAGRVSYSRLALEKAPLLLPAIAVSVATLLIQRDSGAVTTTEALPVGWRFANAMASYAGYLGMTVWPAGLVPLYPFPEQGIPVASVALAILILAAITATVIFFARRAPWAVVGWLWYLGTLVPVIGLIQVGAQSMADRYTYLPQIGVLVMVAWGLRAMCVRWPWSARPVSIAAATVLAASAILASRQTQHWRDSVTLWSYTTSITPESVIARSSLGEAYLQRGALDLARRELEAAIAMRPSHYPARLNLALVAIRQGRLDEALAACRALAEERPEDADVNTAWASALIRSGQYAAAIGRLDFALQSNANHPEALSNRGAALLMLGRNQEALVALEHAVALVPDDVVVLTNLAAAHYSLGQRAEAARICEEALRRDPAYDRALALRKALEDEHR